MGLFFCSLSSGSSGNCYYLGNEYHGILIDAGISARSIRKFLEAKNISLQTIRGILITHNHSDHIRGLEVLSRRNNIPIFTTQEVWKSLISPPSRMIINENCIHTIYSQQTFHLAGFNIEAFPVHHDAPATIGFHISTASGKVTIATDLGYICETAAEYIKKANLLVIESNYDEKMLMEGSYPYYLKARIRSNNGHLGNHQLSDFLCDCITENLTHICLAHLSLNNNTPEIALNSLHNALITKGIRLNDNQKIITLNRSLPTDIIHFQ